MGTMGTVFSIIDTVENVLRQHKLKNPKILIFGCEGRIGSKVSKFLSKEYSVLHFDLGKKYSENIFSEADIIINVALAGNSLLTHIPLMKKEVIVVDDTHPFQTESPKEITLYKVFSQAKGVRFIPGMTGYNPQKLVGCAVEAYVFSFSDYRPKSQHDFNIAARSVGVSSPLCLVE